MKRESLRAGEDETLDSFYHGRIRVIQKKKGYRFSVDAPLLAGFIKTKAAEVLLDLGGVRPQQGAAMAETTSDTPLELAEMRRSIDNIDAALIHLLAERFKCTKAVGEFKARHGLPPADPAREARQIARLRELAKTAKLDPDFAEKFLTFIIQEVIRHHEAIKRR